MKQNILKTFLSLSLGFILFAFTGCNLLSAAGLSDKGLSNKKAPEKLTSTTANSAVNLDHSLWTKLLQKHVDKNGDVDYKAFKDDKKQLEEYLSMLSRNMPGKDWSVQEQLAYYINLYNAHTVALILENYPLKSIKDINSPWTKAIVPVGDKKLALGGIENSILRKMNEPRIHFAINCASISCPKLLNEAYTAAKINEQLDKVTREFINSDQNEIGENSAKLSAIFDWYKKDFITKKIKSVREYVNQYSATKIDNGATISYKDYDWNLNEQK